MESTMNNSQFLPNNYIGMLLGMSDDTKLRIIRLLTDSLLHSTSKVDNPSLRTDEMLKKHAGAWVGDETSDEIISAIKDNSSIRKPLDF